MSNEFSIEGTFKYEHLGYLKKMGKVPLGWFVISSNLVKTAEISPSKNQLVNKKIRRKIYGRWFCIKNKNRTIYRVLKFNPTLISSNNDDKNPIIMLDWAGWLKLSDYNEPKEKTLDLKIRKANLWERNVLAGLQHPEPGYRVASKLAIISIILGVISLLIAFFTFL